MILNNAKNCCSKTIDVSENQGLHNNYLEHYDTNQM